MSEVSEFRIPCALDPMDLAIVSKKSKCGTFPDRVSLVILEGNNESRIVITDPEKLYQLADWLMSAADELSESIE